MKICVFSDSHGTADNMITAIELERPDACFFLGDGSRDIERIGKRYPDMPIYAVKGNCDFMSKFDTSLRCEIDGVIIFAVHGHQSSVKYEDRLICGDEVAAASGTVAVRHVDNDRHFSRQLYAVHIVRKIRPDRKSVV